MSKYVILLEEARSKILPIKETIMTTAPEYIPKLYEAYANENSNLNPMEVRKRIEEDCKDLWSKRTILDALPDEAKNFEKQKAGRQRNKNKTLNSAAVNAAPKLDERIVIDTFGNIISENDNDNIQTFELEEAIRKQQQFVTGDQIFSEETAFFIPKEKLQLINESLIKSNKGCYVKFDKNKILREVQPDIQ